MRVCYTVLSITGSYMKHMCKDVIIIRINSDFIKKMIAFYINIVVSLLWFNLLNL